MRRGSITKLEFEPNPLELLNTETGDVGGEDEMVMVRNRHGSDQQQGCIVKT